MAERKAPPPPGDAWDYRVIDVSILTDELAETALADLGTEHWELVSVDTGRAYLKRKRRPTARPWGVV
jgi:hypothetical protein